MNDRLRTLADAGVSVWLDDLSRERLASGNLAELVRTRSVVGVTTNPTIMAAALAEGERYDEQVRELTVAGASVDEVVVELTTRDVRDACDVLAPQADGTSSDGRVSIEVEPTLAHDTDGTLGSAVTLWDKVGRPNAMVKIPATREGLAAITSALARGISVNVTLIFGTERYREVMDAHLAGLEQARDAGLDLSSIRSVASFFISRIDTEVDRRLLEIGTPQAVDLTGRAAVANARVAHAAHREVLDGDRWRALAADGAVVQRPLWASTGMKSPDRGDTDYVTELVVAGAVMTLPEATLEAFADHGEVLGDTVTGRSGEAQQVLDRIEEVGVDLPDVLARVEDEGVEKFMASWTELLATVEALMSRGGAPSGVVAAG